MSYIKVDTEQYVYIKNPSDSISGFFTSNVVDCVILYIVAPQSKKYFLSHIHRTNCIDHLSQIISKYFKDEIVEIHISGGEFCNGFFPWNVRKRIFVDIEGNEFKGNEKTEKILIDNYKNNKNWGGFLLNRKKIMDFYFPYLQFLPETSRLDVLEYFK